MTVCITITLQPKTKRGPSGEPLYQGTAAWLDAVELANGHGSVCCQAARRLLACGSDPGTRLEFWRDGMLSVSGTIEAFAEKSVREETADGVPRFVRYRPGPAGRVDGMSGEPSTVRSNGRGDRSTAAQQPETPA
jgi:hypothetical protein